MDESEPTETPAPAEAEPSHTWEEHIWPSDLLHVCYECGMFQSGPESIVGKKYGDTGVAEALTQLRGSSAERAESYLTPANHGGGQLYHGGPLLRLREGTDRPMPEPISHVLCPECAERERQRMREKYGADRYDAMRRRLEAQLSPQTHSEPVIETPPAPPLPELAPAAGESEPAKPTRTRSPRGPRGMSRGKGRKRK